MNFVFLVRVEQAKLAKLRRELLTPTSKGGGPVGEGFDVTKSGDARVGLVGFPSVGKSTLLNKLTGTFSEVLHPSVCSLVSAIAMQNNYNYNSFVNFLSCTLARLAS